MGWISADGQHAGYIEYLFADGAAGSGWNDGGIMMTAAPDGTPISWTGHPPSRPPAEVVGWRVVCDCGHVGRGLWRGQRWTRGDAHDLVARTLKAPDDQAVGLVSTDDLLARRLLHNEWVQRHLDPPGTS